MHSSISQQVCYMISLAIYTEGHNLAEVQMIQQIGSVNPAQTEPAREPIQQQVGRHQSREEYVTRQQGECQQYKTAKLVAHKSQLAMSMTTMMM